MSLIKKLGGYENSKCYLESCGDMDLIGGFTPSQITEALLQYRKKHNFFEEGDLIVHPKYDWLILRVHDPIPSEDLLFARTNDHVLFHWGKGLVFDKKGVVAVSYSECKHASDEELELGRMK